MKLGFDLISIALLLALLVGFVRLSLKLEIRFSHIMLLIAFSLIWVPSAEAIGGDRTKAGAIAGLSILYTIILMALSDQSDKLREERDKLREERVRLESARDTLEKVVKKHHKRGD